MCALLVVEDFGTPVVLGVVLVSMLYLAGARLLHLVSVILLVIPIAIAMISKSKERLERITSFLHPEEDPQGAAHQLNQSFLALKNGGLFGQGLAQGNQKLMFLPEGHTDFVLALIGEEVGFIGIACLLGVFVVLILKGFRVSAQASDLFGRYLALGITLLFGVQVLMNAGVVEWASSNQRTDVAVGELWRIIARDEHDGHRVASERGTSTRIVDSGAYLLGPRFSEGVV